MKVKTKKSIAEIINAYNFLVKGLDQQAKLEKSRAYGGVLRQAKGALVETICSGLIQVAWDELEVKDKKLNFSTKKIKIPIKQGYIDKIKDEQLKEYIKKNIDKYFYGLRVDKHIYIDDKFCFAVECKAYTENAMLKRILVDFTLLKTVFPDSDFVLFQLESQLGGDYSDANIKIKTGSPSTQTLISYFDIDLVIITLLEGERKISQPIHKPEFFKELNEKSIIESFNFFKGILIKHLID
ncbi:MAG: restriction endonuclease [Ignavibacteria bacterium]|nr:restriction endonuclease [Ignavibacteria bacterium]